MTPTLPRYRRHELKVMPRHRLNELAEQHGVTRPGGYSRTALVTTLHAILKPKGMTKP